MPFLSLPDERELLRQVAGGNEAAYTRIFYTYSKQVYNVAMLYLKDENAARETVQEIFMKLWLKRTSLTDIADLSDYLFILTRNYIYDGFKKQLVKQKVFSYLKTQEPVHPNDTDHPVQERLYAQLLDKAIAALPPGRKKIYLARKEGLTNEEISHQLNISIHTVKKQMQLAMQSVRAFIRESIQNWLL
ncbi:RNA polymerase sigma factor [Chitinophaga solisilvae]|uniref:RNA polymerase sigma factor n=1 Tax=Chitinophaga solisilvae TaxID=1233460 RepID=UPI00136A0EB5|nr:sigma-70 family RNA polymerase sigma factor [Chitinophaga solisilvae]